MTLERNGSEVKSIGSSSEDPDLIPDTHMVAQTMASVTPVPGDQTIYAQGTHMHAGKTFLNKNKNKSENMCLCFNAVTDCDVFLGGHFGYLWDQPNCKQQSTPVRDFPDRTICGGKTVLNPERLISGDL